MVELLVMECDPNNGINDGIVYWSVTVIRLSALVFPSGRVTLI